MQILVTRSNVFSLEGPMGLEEIRAVLGDHRGARPCRAGQARLGFAGSGAHDRSIRRVNRGRGPAPARGRSREGLAVLQTLP
ncbi:MAG: hypothetical protein UX71_C0001G0106 [Parcubacteria group bacterium GW2011_GWA1_47_10]|nr:MAG: hypothetical protein UX71_C0001G0106 [Parcubacteria group bacterium GW2011_GWA1_47_10]